MPFFPLCSGLLTELDVDFEGVRLQHPKEDYVKQFTFNSARKSMTTVIPLPNNKGSRVLTKGASEIVLSKCANILTATGEVGVVELNHHDSIILKILCVHVHVCTCMNCCSRFQILLIFV